MEQWVFTGKPRFLYKARGIRTVEAYPAVFPRILLIRFIGDNLIRTEQKPIPCGKGIPFKAIVKAAAPGNNIMDCVMIPHSRAPGMAGAAALQAAAVNGKAQAVVKRRLERMLKFFTCQTKQPPLSRRLEDLNSQ